MSDRTNASRPMARETGGSAPAEDLRPAIADLKEEIAALREEVRRLRGRTDSDALLTKGEAAELLGVSPRTVDTLIAEGTIASIKVRQCRRIPRGALEAYIERKVRQDN